MNFIEKAGLITMLYASTKFTDGDFLPIIIFYIGVISFVFGEVIEIMASGDKS